MSNEVADSKRAETSNAPGEVCQQAAEVTVLMCSDDSGDRCHVFTTPEAAYTTWARIPGVREFFAQFDPELLERIEAGGATGEREDALRTFNDSGQDWYIIETLAPEEHPYQDGDLV